MNNESRAVIGLVPAAGSAKRIGPLPCSKEIYPIGFRRDASGETRPHVASHHLFQKFRRAGATTAFVILRDGKWDIPAYFGDGTVVGIELAYLVIPGSIGPPDTLDRAYSFVSNNIIVFGFPDIIFSPDDVFERLLTRMRQTHADVVLGLYRAHDVRQMDMIDVDGEGRVRSVILKPPSSTFRYAWVCAAWTPVFTRFMHDFLQHERAKAADALTPYRLVDAQGDLPMGAVIKAAVKAGLLVYGVDFPSDTYLDIGTPKHLIEAVRTGVTPE